MSIAYQDTELKERSKSWVVERSYLENRDSVFRWCLRYAGGRSDWAEDATQEVFIRLLENVATIEDPEHIRPWLYRVAANVAISRMRRDRLALRKLRNLFVGTEHDVASPVDDLLEGKQEAAEAMRQLGRLPVKQRVVVCMKILDGKSQKQIADTLGLSEGYVSKLLARSWKNLRAAGWEVES